LFSNEILLNNTHDANNKEVIAGIIATNNTNTSNILNKKNKKRKIFFNVFQNLLIGGEDCITYCIFFSPCFKSFSTFSFSFLYFFFESLSSGSNIIRTIYKMRVVPHRNVPRTNTSLIHNGSISYLSQIP